MIAHKGVALGNDYLVVDATELPWPLTPARCAAICDRHCGLGSDGILVADLRSGISLRILNPDGSEAEKSGNGLRIFAAWLHGKGLVRNDWFEIKLVKDTVRARVDGVTSAGLDIHVEMGTAKFEGAAVNFLPESGMVIDYTLTLPGGGEAVINTVSLSNPHCVVFVDSLDRADFLERAPKLCTHSGFANGTNVQFARVAGPSELELWIWERGAGETLASGSSACAATAAAVHKGLLQPGNILARMQGGNAEIGITEGFAVTLRGPARIVYRAEVPVGQLAAWSAL